MLQSKHKAYDYIMQMCKPMALKNDIKEYANYIYEKHNIPTDVTGDIILNRVEETVATASDQILFALIEAIPEFVPRYDKTVSFYFTETEIKRYTSWKYKERKLEFPIVLDCIQVENDIWVGSADVDWFMLLRNASIIRYNPEIQRTMKRIVKNGREEWVITKNAKAIKGIVNSYDNDSYIPNTIVLNISDDSDGEFYYDAENKQLIITSIKYLDILDGYHRYYGMCLEKDLKPNFNTKFILQITNFETDKGKQYINQQDLKTPMSKIDAMSMNMEAPEVRVCEILNNKAQFYWRKQIKRNDGYINLPEMASIIWRYYFVNTNRVTQKELATITNTIQNNINTILDEYPEYMDRNITYRELVVLLYFCRYCMETENDKIKYLPKISEVMKETEKEQYKQHWYKSGDRPLKPKTIKMLDELVK